MAIIAQKKLFGWKEIDGINDLSRLDLVFSAIDDEALVRQLERARDKGRDKYPVRAMWNSLLAMIVYQHTSIESLRRELQRNPALLEKCGFDPFKGIGAVPTSSAYSRFNKTLLERTEELKCVFRSLVGSIGEELGDFGEYLAIDGKAISSYGRPVADEKKKKGLDGRRDLDADWGVKSYTGVDKAGREWRKEKSWFGYKVHLLADSKYEMPVDFLVTKASQAEQPMAVKMLDTLGLNAPLVAQRARYLTGDKGYDDTKILVKAYDTLGIQPVIDIRNTWRDSDKTRVVTGSTQVVYDYKGTVSCVCSTTLAMHPMCYGGYEKDRKSLKYLCPALAKGVGCEGRRQCTVGRQIRIPLDEDRRIFTPVARSSYRWKNLYNMRSAVERINSRIDGSFLFEQHTIRGRSKMEVRVSMAFIVMLSMALGRIRQNQEDLMRSLVKGTAGTEKTA